MKLHYQNAVRGNFGDALNEWLWQRLLPDMWNDDDVVFVGVGTLIDRDVPQGRLRVVFGSGAGYAPPPDGMGAPDANWKIYGVRGPLTARVIGIDPSLAVTDSAILVSRLDELRGEPRGDIVFVPHWKSVRFGAWAAVCRDLGIHFVDPCDDSRDVIRRIAGARHVIAESMHAAIIADAFRVPWTPVVLSREVSPFKWADWASSLGLPYAPYCLPPSTAVEAWRNHVLRWTVYENIYDYPDSLDAPRALAFEDPDRLIDDFWTVCGRIQQPWRQVSSTVIEAGFKRLSALGGARGGNADRYRARARAGLERLAAQPGMLSEDADHARALERTLAALDSLKSDWAGAFAGVCQ